MQEDSFFSYDVNEALHFLYKERQIVLDCFGKIEYELQQAIDKHNKTLIAFNIELFLKYCIRFYDRQFITRDNIHKGIPERFENLLNVTTRQTNLKISVCHLLHGVQKKSICLRIILTI